MRLLCVHADALTFEAREQARPDERVEDDGVPMDGGMDDCVAAFVGVEPEDSEDIDGTVAAARSEIEAVTARLDTTRVVLYPSGHLTDDVAASQGVDAVMATLETTLRDRGCEVLRAPDGWYKHLDISAKGHRFARRSSRVTAGSDERVAGDASEWALLFPDGTRVDPLEATPAVEDFTTAFVERVIEGGETATARSRPLDPLSEAGFVATTDPSGEDSVVYTPRWTVLRTGLREYLGDRIVDYGAIPVGTASNHSSPGAAVQAIDLSPDALPLTLCELTGDPSMDAVTADGDQAREAMSRLATFTLRTTEELGLGVSPVVRLHREYYENHAAWVEQVVSDLGQPVLLERFSDSARSPTVSIELPTVDSDGRKLTAPTVRLDDGSAQRHGIEFVDGDERRRPTVVHCSPPGIDALAAALVAHASETERPQLPTWLSPTQVRFIPVVPDEHLSVCGRLADELERANVRVDIDDRAETVGGRIESANREWVPYFAVVGDDELESERLGVTVRAEHRETEMTSEELRERVVDDCAGRPGIRRYVPRHVGDRPDFVE